MDRIPNSGRNVLQSSKLQTCYAEKDIYIWSKVIWVKTTKGSDMNRNEDTYQLSYVYDE